MMLTLGLAFWITSMLVVLFFLISLLLMLIVLIQRPQGGGLSGAFGAGAGSGQTAFGVKTGDALTWATIVGFALFLGMAVALNYAMRPADATGATQPAATSGQPAQPAGAGPTTIPVQPAEPAGQTPAPAPAEPEQPAGAPTETPPMPEDQPAEAPTTPGDQPTDAPSADEPADEQP